MPSLRLSIALLGAGLVAACATQNTSLHKNLSQRSERPLPRRILLAQPDIRLHEISAGGMVEKVDDWSNKASNEAAKSVELVAQSTTLFETVQPSQLSDAERATLDQYGALYALVAGSADLARNSRFEAWSKRAADFDYTLGPGMVGVAESARLDAVIFVVGTDYISSSGRMALMTVAMLGGALSGRYGGPEPIPAFLSVGVVDMRTGELLWYSTEIRSGSADLRDPRVVRNIVDDLFKTYPGATKTVDANKQ